MHGFLYNLNFKKALSHSNTNQAQSYLASKNRRSDEFKVAWSKTKTGLQTDSESHNKYYHISLC